jgi:hypothetical protein
VGRQEELHLDVDDTPALVPSPHVEHRQLVFRKVLLAERVEDLDAPDRDLGAEDRVQQVDQNVRVPLVTEDPLERIVDFRIDSQWHPTVSKLQGAVQPVSSACCENSLSDAGRRGELLRLLHSQRQIWRHGGVAQNGTSSSSAASENASFGSLLSY